MVAQLQEPVLGVVALAAVGALQIPAPSGALVIVVLGDGERRAATAGHEIHLGTLWIDVGHCCSKYTVAAPDFVLLFRELQPQQPC
jgi:hypothetical protein